MRGLQPMHNRQGMPEGRPTADSSGTGFASAGTPAEHRMKGVTLPTPTGDPGRGSDRTHRSHDRGTLHNLEGMPEGRPTADSSGTGFASAGTPAEHRMKGVTLPTPTGICCR